MVINIRHIIVDTLVYGVWTKTIMLRKTGDSNDVQVSSKRLRLTEKSENMIFNDL